jgi:hypothetical protein
MRGSGVQFPPAAPFEINKLALKLLIAAGAVFAAG